MEATSQPHHPLKRVIESKAPQECITTVASPKPNQVGTVLLYGIPIVSLYIESQERLCLAQISNTLLKQYSYNEIHNRRVALGITCVQCTPVQLEILRRAGAMPVSSRRCGMITRREAERLCKSFLGDNTPPRLPEDFAFSVHHECAWGCRGSFLPARYNSSRAKCIKCAYCALFFSPNKFIFHSHRIGPSDKYVQPDAANFNSWRRHMKLSGNPHEKIVHAWEDVKAMFNGGTRKRLIMSATSGGRDSHSGRANNHAGSPKRMKESSPIGRHDISPPLIHAAAAVTVVSAASSTGTANMPPIRPVQLLPNGAAVPTTGNNVSSLASSTASMSPSSGTISAGTAASSRIPALCSELHFPFTRGLMMDYMWHSQTKASAFQFSNYLQPWIKRPGALFLNEQHQHSQHHPANGVSIAPAIPLVASTDESYTAGDATSSSQPPLSPPFPSKATLPSYNNNNSAFRPVVNHHQHSRVSAAGASAMASTVHLLEDDQQTTSSRNSRDDGTNGSATIKESLSSDEEMVDIETTEDDDNPRAPNNNPHHSSSNDQHHHQSRNSGTIQNYQHIDELIAVKVSKPSSPSIVSSNPSNKINCWNDTAADYLKKRLTCRNLSSFQPTTTPSPSLEPAHSSPASISSCGASSDESSPDVFPLPSRDLPNMLHISSPPAIVTDPISAVSSAGPTAAATAAAAAVAIAAFSHISCQPSPSAKSTSYEGILPTVPPSLPSQSFDQSDKGLTNNLYGNLIINNNNNNNRNMNNNSFNNGSNVSQQQIKNGIATNSRDSSEEHCSVARLSFDRMDYNSLTPFYRHDITKHFHSFRHQSEQQPQTNGGIG